MNEIYPIVDEYVEPTEEYEHPEEVEAPMAISIHFNLDESETVEVDAITPKFEVTIL